MDAQYLKSAIKGWLVPIYQMDQPDGRRLHGLGPEDFDKVRAGYACAKCLAEFHTYMAVCPLCHERRDIAADIGSAPEYWQASVDERENDTTPYAKLRKNPFDDAMRNLGTNDNVENIPLSKLAPGSGKRRARRN